MLLNRKTIERRPGFTLVELMVAAALAITIMWILSESFKMGIDFARTARSTGDMMGQLNNAGQILSRDLQASHFLMSDAPPVAAGAMRNTNTTVSPVMPDMMTAPIVPNNINGRSTVGTGYTPPNGYFMLVSPPPGTPNPVTQTVPQSYASFRDDTEGFTISTTNPITTGTAAGAQLAFTVFLPPGLPQNQFVATCPVNSGNVYYSRVAEIGYFLGSPAGAGLPIGQTPALEATPELLAQQPNLNTAQQNLYNLYRRQRLVAENSDFAQLKPGVNPQPPNLNAAVSPTTNGLINGPANPYYDPTASDVISFTPLPPTPGKPLYKLNTLVTPGDNSSVGFGAAFSFPTPFSPQIPPSRFGPVGNVNGLVPLAPLATQGRAGDDIVLTDVLSFEVLAVWVPAPYPFALPPPTGGSTPGIRQPSFNAKRPPQAIPGPRPFTVTNPTPLPTIPGAPIYPVSNTTPFNSNYPFDFLPQLTLNPFLPHTFDTWFTITQPNGIWNNFTAAPTNPWLIPMPARITALQITIRIFDRKTNQARQNTWRIAM
jgi:type II secretory pathway pseudopilin PulG